MEDVIEALNTLTSILTSYGYIGVFLISLIASSIIFVPLPYLAVVFISGSQLNPLLVGIASAIGASIGKTFIYYIGRSGRIFLGQEKKRKLEYAKYLAEKYGAFAIFLFAASPLPDDMLYVPLGMMGYNLLKFFIYCLAGKIILASAVSYAGHFSIEWVARLFSETTSWTIILVSIIFLVASVYATLKVNWEEIFYRFMVKVSKYNEKKSEENS